MSSTDTPVGEIRKLRLADLDLTLQTRSEIRRDAVAEYATQIGKGERFPRPIVFEHQGRLFLVSGHHRVQAYRVREYAELECEVRQGDPISAITAGIKANDEQRAERLTRADRHHTVILLLRLDASLSNYAIAEICGVSEGTVRNCREELPTAQITQSRVGRDGRTRRVPERPAEADDDAQEDSAAEHGEESKTDKLSLLESKPACEQESKSIGVILIDQPSMAEQVTDVESKPICDSVSQNQSSNQTSSQPTVQLPPSLPITVDIDEAGKHLARFMSRLLRLKESNSALYADVESLYYAIDNRLARHNKQVVGPSDDAVDVVAEEAETALSALVIALDKLKRFDRPRGVDAVGLACRIGRILGAVKHRESEDDRPF